MSANDVRLSMDLQGLESLKRTAKVDQSKGLKGAAQQFEAYFLREMLKSMRETVPKSDLTDDSTVDIYTQMLDGQLAQSLAGRGFGFAEMIEREMLLRGDVKPLKEEVDLIAGIPRAKPRELLDPLMHRPQSSIHSLPSKLENPFASASYLPSSAERAPHVESFLRRLSGPAKAVSKDSGLPAELILAQAALETGWGRQKIKTADGRDSHNLFGIKAGSSWKGATTEIATTEYVGGKPVVTTESFRVYPNEQASLADYARLITQSSRYQQVVQASDAKSAARAIQDAGYATDPAYAQKLISIIDSIGALPAQAKADDIPFGSLIW